jgi:hypothetical protein
MARRKARSSATRQKMLRLIERSILLCLVVVFTNLLANHQSGAARRPAPSEPPQKQTAEAASRASAENLGVMTWNLNWFQDPSHGPRDETGQYEGVRAVLRRFPMALVGLVEVVSEAAFYRLVGDLPGYSGVLSTYRNAQKTGLLFADRFFALDQSRPLTALTTARRPPLEVQLRSKSTGQPLYVVVVHAKAYDDVQSYRERARFSQKLKAYLDGKRRSVPLIVLGDFNDLFINSITANMPSPYQNFVDDRNYLAATRSLNLEPRGEGSSKYGSTIDHIILSDELAPSLVPRASPLPRARLGGRRAKGDERAAHRLSPQCIRPLSGDPKGAHVASKLAPPFLRRRGETSSGFSIRVVFFGKRAWRRRARLSSDKSEEGPREWLRPPLDNCSRRRQRRYPRLHPSCRP